MGLEAFRADLGSIRRIALDTSACIYYLGRVQPWATLVDAIFDDAPFGAREVHLSTVVQLELLVRPLRDRNPREVFRVLNLTERTNGVYLTDMTTTIVRMAATTRAHARLKLPDAVVAASAVSAGCPVLVGNDRDYRALESFDASRSVLAPMTRMPRYIHLDDYVEGA